MKLLASLSFFLVTVLAVRGESDRPHIVFIAADDLGWNDVGFRNPDIFSPNIDRLAHEGVILNRSYVQPLCSPTRSTFMSGRFPFHTGLQTKVIMPELGYGLNLSITTTPQHLKKLGYATHIVGKWHLGFCKEDYTPTRRGFDTFIGYYLGEEDYFKHDRSRAIPDKSGKTITVNGLDFHRDNGTSFTNVVTDNETYSTYVFAREAINVIEAHDPKTPLYLYLPFQAVHGPLEAPQRFIDKYENITNKARRTFSAMVSALDEAIGNITEALEKAGLWENTLLVFTTDNGGPVHSANNWPLRGSKHTVWEGGTRGTGFIHGSMLKKTGYTYEGIMHSVDWYPTIIGAAGGYVEDPEMDGMNMWPALQNGHISPRTSFVYNIDITQPIAAIRSGPWKFINGTPDDPGWYPPANESFSFTAHSSELPTDEDEAGKNNQTTKWLFNLDDDPLEKNNLYESEPEQAAIMENQLKAYMKSYVPDLWHQYQPDPKCNPANFNGAWSPGWC